VKFEKDFAVTGPASRTIDLGAIDPVEGDWHWPRDLSPVHFLKLDLKESSGKLLSQNFYWRGPNSGLANGFTGDPDNLKPLDSMKTVTLQASAAQSEADGKLHISVSLHNPGPGIALMAHLQLRHGKPSSLADPLTNVTDRVLPVYYSDNYISLVPGESRTITIEAAEADLKGDPPQIVVDGWNIAVAAASSPVPITLNLNAQVDHWPVTGLPIVAHTWK
jgi:hypothetical protein